MQTSTVRWLAAATAVSAALTMVAQLSGITWLAFVCKPLATLLIIAYAWQREGDAPRRRRFVRLGLVLSLAGDVALLWPREGFLPGLVAFLLAHLAYLVAFTATTRLAARWHPFALYAVVAGAVLAVLWPGVPAGLRAPVVAYVICLAAMAAQAATWWRDTAGSAIEGHARWAALGGALFVASDALLAVNRFQGAIPLSAVWVLGTYWAAQWLIASSLRARSADPR
jgi:uncharacterized membrane protein YhhN